MTEARKSRVLRAKLAVASARIEASERRSDAIVAVGSVLGRTARRLLLRVHANEQIPLPQPLVVAGTSSTSSTTSVRTPVSQTLSLRGSFNGDSTRFGRSGS